MPRHALDCPPEQELGLIVNALLKTFANRSFLPSNDQTDEHLPLLIYLRDYVPYKDCFIFQLFYIHSNVHQHYICYTIINILLCIDCTE